LERHRLIVVRNFDLRDALHTQNSPCTCPHHGTADCDCNYVVLLVYDGAAVSHGANPAGRIIIHSHDGTTWLSVPTTEDEARHRQQPQAETRLLRSVAEVMCEAAL
jgi:hypothetical protein